MKNTIKLLGERINQIEIRLFANVMALDNHMEDCDCDDAVVYHFHNILPHTEHCSFCLNCGGMVEFED